MSASTPPIASAVFRRSWYQSYAVFVNPNGTGTVPLMFH